jgi:hypothetical protein
VGTTDTQTLTNKTLVNPTFNNPSITGTVSGAASYTGITLTNNPVVTGNMDVNGTAPGTAQLDVMAAAGQTAGIQRWLNSGGSTLASITGSGVVNAASGLTVTPSAVGNVASTVTGLASQTASLEQWKNSTGTVLAEITAAGRLNANTGATLVGDPSPSTGGVSIKAGPSSNNITEFHDAANALKANIDTNGALHAGGVTVPLDSSAANGGGIGNIQLNRASGSQNVTGTTLVDNTVGLTFDVLAGGTYKVEFRASFEGPSAAGVRAAWRQTGASANDLARFITAPGVTTTSVADGTFQGSQRGSATTVGVGISPTIGASLQEDFVYTATADTTWIFQFCQNTSNASPVTLSPVSYVLVTKIQGL